MPLTLEQSIDPASPEWKDAAPLLQGNITKAFDRRHMALLAIQITPGPGIREQFCVFAQRFVTSAANYDAGRKQYADEVAGNLFLTVSGYFRLGYTFTEITAAFPDTEGFHTNWFLAGMEAKGAMLADDPSSGWDAAYRGRQMDALLLLAADGVDALDGAVLAALGGIVLFGTCTAIERGAVLQNEAGQRIEPFGFADGISNPTVFADKPNSTFPRHLLVPDRLANDPNAFGSYLVYRKIEQDVDGFARAVGRLVQYPGAPLALAEAMVIGRFKDGTPLSYSGVPNGNPIAVLDYAGQNDLQGVKCPLHAHIRKVNPRVKPDMTAAVAPLSGAACLTPQRARRVSFSYRSKPILCGSSA